MRHLDIPGGWYADALPSGAYAVLMPGSHLETHRGRIDLPPGDQPLYHRITEHAGVFRIAGQAHASPATLEWAGAWMHHPIVACGVSPVIYDPSGLLRISDCSIGSQGWRYVAPDGRLMTGDDTYGSSFSLAEWTDLSDQQDRSLVIGQGNPGGGVMVWDGAVRRLLEPGPCRFIRAHRAGDQCALAWWVEGVGAVVLWATVAELRALPVVSGGDGPDPGDEDRPAPIPVPPPPPKESPVPVPNLLDLVREERAKYGPIPTGEELGKLMNAVAWRGNGGRADGPWGLSRKPHGKHVLAPDGTPIAEDILHHQPSDTLFDVLIAAGERSEPTWGEVAHHRDPARPWVAPTRPAGSLPPPVPGPSPGTGPVLDTRLIQPLAEIMRGQAQIDAAVVALRALSPPAMPDCPEPRWPDHHECPVVEAAPSWPSHAEIVAMKEGWHAAFGRRLHEAQLVHLLYMYFADRADADAIARQIQEWRG